jgi:hypothetical protein
LKLLNEALEVREDEDDHHGEAKSKMKVLYNKPYSPRHGKTLENLIINESKQYNKRLTDFKKNIYTTDFIKENISHKFPISMPVFEKRTYQGVQIKDSSREIDYKMSKKDASRELNELTLEEANNTVYKDIEYLKADDNNNNTYYDEKNNLFNEFSEDDIEKLADISEDPRKKKQIEESFKQFLKSISGRNVDEIELNSELIDNSFIKSTKSNI